MTAQKEKAPIAAVAKQDREEGKNRKSVQFHEEGVTMTSMMTQKTPVVEFDAAHHIVARFAGGTITVDVQHEDWIGEQLVRVETPGTVLHLRTHEARDLAAALQNIATHLDESGVTC